MRKWGICLPLQRNNCIASRSADGATISSCPASATRPSPRSLAIPAVQNGVNQHFRYITTLQLRSIRDARQGKRKHTSSTCTLKPNPLLKLNKLLSWVMFTFAFLSSLHLKITATSMRTLSNPKTNNNRDILVLLSRIIRFKQWQSQQYPWPAAHSS